MTEEEYHRHMAEEWAKQRPRPGTTAYKNRNHVQAKLPDHIYRAAWHYCQDHGLSFNTLTRILYERFFSNSTHG
jgi:hypothetical protein